MVSIAENWTFIVGTVETLQPVHNVDAVDLVVKIDTVAEVKGFRSYLTDAAGSTLQIRIPRELVASSGVTPGCTIHTRVRRGRNSALVFAHTREFTVDRR